MARQMVVLALIFVAFVGLVSAAETAKAPAAATPQSSDAGTSSPLAEPMSPPSPTGESTVAGPTTAGAPTPTPGKSGATTLKVSSIVGVAAITGFFIY